MPTPSLFDLDTTLALIVVLAPFSAAILALLFRRQPRWVTRLTIAFSMISFLASIFVAERVVDEVLSVRLIWIFQLYLDSLSVYFMLLVNLVALFASFLTGQFLKHDARHNRFHNPAMFHLFFNLFHMTMLLVPMVDNLAVLWIMVELTTVFSTILVRYRRNRLSLEAAWKFIMITTTGIIFALLGTLFLAYAVSPVDAAGQHDTMSWSYLVSKDVVANLDKKYVMLSFLFILLGYGTKAGLAPMHTWLPDGHGEAPAPVSALLSGVMLKSALYAILRFYTITNLSLGSSAFTSQLLMASGMLSLVLATPFILKRNRFKRVLAYHSLEHMGIITFGIGIGTPVALFAALLHTLNHAVTKALMFLLYGSIQYEYSERCGDVSGDSGEEQVQGVLKTMPFSGTMLAFGGLALVGSPPFNIFMSEFMILWAAVSKAADQKNPWLWVAISLFALTVTMIFAGLVGHLSRLLLGRAPFPPIRMTRQRITALTPFFLLLVIIGLFGVLVPAWPVDIPQLLDQSVQILQHGAALDITVRSP